MRSNRKDIIFNLYGEEAQLKVFGNLLDFVHILAEELISAGVLPKNFNIKEHMKLVQMQKGDVPITCEDTSALEKDFGYKPSTSLREGLSQFSQWYKIHFKK